MSKRDFFRVLIKIFGLYSLVLALFSYFPWNFNSFRLGEDLWPILWVVGFTIVIIGVYALLIIKVDTVVDWLKLDKGFDDDRIELGNFNAASLVSFASILIGGFLIVDYFPSLLHNCYLAFKENVQTNGLNDIIESFSERAGYFELTIAVMNMIIGYLLLTNHSKVAQLLTKTKEEKSV